MEEVFVILNEDRHCDTHVELWLDKNLAIERARQIAKDSCRTEDDYVEEEVPNWIFYAQYSCEGDFVRVTSEKIMDEEPIPAEIIVTEDCMYSFNNQP